jgi:hypothetical protein
MTARKLTPNTIIARVLKSMGLAQGIRKDFTVTGNDWKDDGGRTHTIAVAIRPNAARIIRDRAEEIERATADAGTPFTVAAATDFYGNVSALITHRPEDPLPVVTSQDRARVAYGCHPDDQYHPTVRRALEALTGVPLAHTTGEEPDANGAMVVLHNDRCVNVRWYVDGNWHVYGTWYEPGNPHMEQLRMLMHQFEMSGWEIHRDGQWIVRAYLPDNDN